MDALRIVNTMKAKMKTLKKGVKVLGSSSFHREREAKVKAPKTPMFKGVDDTNELENFLCQLEN